MSMALFWHRINRREFSHAYAVFVIGGESPWGANFAYKGAAIRSFRKLKVLSGFFAGTA